MAASLDEKVYLTFRPIIRGTPKAEFRQPKAVRRLINETYDHPAVISLLKVCTREVVCECLCRLLAARVFESDSVAKSRFPHARPFAKPYTLAGRAKGEAETSSMEEDEGSSESGSEGSDDEEVDKLKLVPGESKYPKQMAYFEISLPLHIQHLVLSRIQGILECACFYFAQKRMPDIAEAHDWDCPKAAELNQWINEFRRKISVFESNIENPRGHDVLAHFHSATRIRHIAVHREYVEPGPLQELITNAGALCKMIKNKEAFRRVELIRKCVESEVSKLKSLRGEIVTGLVSTLDAIAAQRVELQRLEEQSVAVAFEKLEDRQYVACDALEDILLDKDMALFAAGRVNIAKVRGEEDDEAEQDQGETSEGEDDEGGESEGEESEGEGNEGGESEGGEGEGGQVEGGESEGKGSEREENEKIEAEGSGENVNGAEETEAKEDKGEENEAKDKQGRDDGEKEDEGKQGELKKEKEKGEKEEGEKEEGEKEDEGKQDESKKEREEEEEHANIAVEKDNQPLDDVKDEQLQTPSSEPQVPQTPATHPPEETFDFGTPQQTELSQGSPIFYFKGST